MKAALQFILFECQGFFRSASLSLRLAQTLQIVNVIAKFCLLIAEQGVIRDACFEES